MTSAPDALPIRTLDELKAACDARADHGHAVVVRIGLSGGRSCKTICHLDPGWAVVHWICGSETEYADDEAFAAGEPTIIDAMNDDALLVDGNR